MSRALVAAALALAASAAGAQTVGLHLVSHHFPSESYLHDVNPGVYVRFDNGATLGAYRNSFGRASAYAGWTLEHGPFALTLGAVSGYQVKRTVGPTTCAQVGTGVSCAPTWTDEGNSRGAIGPLLAPSVALPAVLGITPRVTVLPKFTAKGHTVAHLSIERAF